MDCWTFLSSSDAALVRKVLDDRPEAFEDLVFRYQHKAQAVARALGVPEARVDDVVQEAFLKALENLPHLRSPEKFGPWFLNIARNAARNCLQDLRRRAPDALAGPAAAYDTAALEREELREAVWRRVAELPLAVREAVFLYYHEGESVRAVAKTLGTSRAAVLKRLERGRNLLREKLWRELEDSIREMVPSTRERRRTGRQLAILLVGVAATSWGIRAAPAAAGGAQGGKAWLLDLFLGGMQMTAKKHLIAIGLAILVMAAGVYLSVNRFGGRERAALPGPAGSGAAVAPRAIARAPAGPERSQDAAAAVDSGAAKAAPLETPPSIFGRVVDVSGKGIPGARAIALPAEEWDGLVARAAARLVDPPDGDAAGARRAAGRDLARRAASLAGTTTDEAGEYRFQDLAEGEYRVICGHGAHLPRTDGRAVVRSGEPCRLDIELAEGMAIGGRVIDESGRPVPAASITALRSMDRLVDPERKLDRIIDGWAEAGFLLDPGRAVSDEEGAFRVNALEPLPHDLGVEKEGYAPGQLNDVAAGGQAVELVLSRGLSIRGRVLDFRREPREGAEAALVLLGPGGSRRQDGEGSGADDEDLALKTSTDAEGAFELGGLSAGSFELRVSSRGFPVRRQEVRLEKASADLGDVVLDAPLAVSGRILDSRGAPLAGARVHIEERVASGVAVHGTYGRRHAPPTLAETRTEADGSFRIDELEEGVYTLHASSRDHAAVSLPAVTPGQDPIEVRLADGAALEGVVIDAMGRFPIPGAEIVPGRGRVSDPEKKTVSGPDGSFTIRGIAPDDRKILLTVTHADYPWQPSETRWDTSNLGRSVEVLIYPSERIGGTVRDASGNPVEGARVRYEVPGWERVFVFRVTGGLRGSARSAADGSFEVEVPSLLRGIRFPHDRAALELVAAHPSLGTGRSASIDPPLEGEPWPGVEITLLEPSSLEGKVTDASGPFAGAVVLAARKSSPEDGRALDRGPVHAASSDASGGYRIRGLERGIYQVEARGQGRPRALIDPVEVGAEPRVLDVVLESGTEIEGSVADDAGEAVPGAEVFARDGSTVIASAVTDAGGRWRLEGIPARELTLGARAPLHEPAEVQVKRPRDAPRELVLTRLASLSGSVLDSSNGRPVPSFEVFAGMDTPGAGAGERPREFIDPRGSFRREGLRPGSYIVAIRSNGFAVWTENVTLAPGEETAVRALLDRGRTLRGAVIDRDTGLPVASARVQCSMHGAQPEELASRFPGLNGATGWTDEAGEFALAGLPPGEYTVGLQHRAYMPEGDRGKVIIGDGDPEPLRLVMVPAGEVAGKIENLGRSWSIALMLVLRRIDGEPAGEIRCQPQPDGSFHLTSMPPGTYRVELGTFETKPKPQIVRRGEPLGEVVIRAGETATFDARAP